MRGKLVCVGALVLLISFSAPGQDSNSVRVFGLEFTVISNAVIEAGNSYLKAIQIGGPECDDTGGGGTNEIEDLPFGVSVHLGEAQSGVYIYPGVECRADTRFMWGNAYGNLNGETNRLISSIKGTRVEWGRYNIEVDLTPLGATSYTYQVWSHGLLTLHATNQGALSAISTYSIEDYEPRVNPCVLTDLGPAALIEFPNGTQFGVGSPTNTGNFGRSGVGDRIFLIAEGATNHVNYLSRVDVFGSANLPSFQISDARLGMFGRPHKAMGAVNLTAANGRLSVGPFEPSTVSGGGDGLLVDFKNGAVRWSAQTAPFALQATNGYVLLSASGLGSSDSPSSRYWGPVGFDRSNGMCRLFADFVGLDASNSVLRVFRGETLSGTIVGANGTFMATLTDTNPVIAGWAAELDTLAVSIAEPTRVTAHDGAVLEGDRFEFAPYLSPVRIGQIHSAHIVAQGTAGFTITSEVTQEAPVPELRLQIDRAPSGLVVSWPYHRSIYVETRSNLLDGFTWDYQQPLFRDFRWFMPVNPTNAARFYSLRHIYWHYINP